MRRADSPSFIRCPGGKRRLVPSILALVTRPPTSYAEPFIGGGSVFFAVRACYGAMPTMLGDIDSDLIQLYVAVRNNHRQLLRETNYLIEEMHAYPERALAIYMRERATWNSGLRGTRTPARHLFLRRACFNGLWRVNRHGLMNTHWRGEPPPPFPRDSLDLAAQFLQDVTLQAAHFKAADLPVDRSPSGRAHPLIYLDPPYLDRTASDARGFTGYASPGWQEDDFVVLLRRAAQWSAKGAQVILSHADNPRTRQLLAAHWPAASLVSVSAARRINRDGAGRGPVPELLVTESVPLAAAHAPTTVRTPVIPPAWLDI